MGKLTIVDLVDKNFNFVPTVFGFEDFFEIIENPQINYHCHDEFLGEIFESVLGIYTLGGGFNFSREEVKIEGEDYIPFIEKSFFNFMHSKTGLFFENKKQVELYKKEVEEKMKKALEERDLSKINLLTKSMNSTEILVRYKLMKKIISYSKINTIYNEKVRVEIDNYKNNINLKNLDKFNNYLLKIYGLNKFILK